MSHSGCGRLQTCTEPYLNTIARRSSRPEGECSQTRIHRFGFQRENREDAFVYPPERLAPGGSVECLEAERVLARGQRALVTEASRAQPVQIGRLGVVGPVDDPQVLRPAHLQAGLNQPPAAADQ